MNRKKESITVVWYKRDLRLKDHKPLFKASQANLPVLLLYCFEPSVINYLDSDIRHWRFVYQSLQDLNKQLSFYNAQIFICFSEAINVFEILNKHYEIKSVYSHAETGNNITFQRDLKIADFFLKNKIVWKEYQANGVIRRLKSRTEWNKRWNDFMLTSEVETDIAQINFLELSSTELNKLVTTSIPKEFVEPNNNFQQGGETLAIKYLQSFLVERYENYSKHISKPENSRKSCSRLSAYLAWGNISMRTVYQETLKHYSTAKSKRALSNFISRLHWHCHFIQKFEDECQMEFQNINKGFDSLVKPRNDYNIAAWETGKTGVPLVDACMRCVVETGYLNFRMRAMVVSFFTHHLWQDWRHGVHFLAKQFLDYEPGIHYPQFQMQAGVTGINTVRIYSPVKNSVEHDEDAVFIKKWVPEIASIPVPLIFEPWKMSLIEQQLYKVELGKDYPLPIVELDAARKKASDIIWNMKKKIAVQKEAKRILQKHTKQTSNDD